MKIRLSQLRRIIKEEIARTLLTENFEFKLSADQSTTTDSQKSPRAFYRVDLKPRYEAVKKNLKAGALFEELLGKFKSVPKHSGEYAKYVRGMKEEMQAKDSDTSALAAADSLVYSVGRLPDFGIPLENINTLSDVGEVVTVNQQFGEETEEMRRSAALGDYMRSLGPIE